MKKSVGSLVAVLVILSAVTPSLHTVVLADPDDFAGGDGSSGDPYQITDWNHLDNVRYSLSSHFILMNDLDSDTDGYVELAGLHANGDLGWQPIGVIGNAFTGSFKGQGHEIRDLCIGRPTDNRVGLFGLVVDGVIDTVGLLNAQVAGNAFVGGLVGASVGTVSNCYASGSVTGVSGVGGLVGSEEGTVINCYATNSVNGYQSVGGLIGSSQGAVGNCYATGSVEGYEHVGGLVGEKDEGTVSNCYASGSVTGDSRVGGLIGYNEWSTLSDCYATGSVTGSSEVGGLVGYSYGSTVTSCFWDTQTSGIATDPAGTDKTTAEMQNVATYREQGTDGLAWPWDILSVAEGGILPYAIWNIVDGEGYPFLTFRQVELEVKAGWNLVSVPGGLADSANTVEDVFGDQIEAIYSWSPEDPGSYDVPTVVEPNQGYWVAVTEDKTLTLRI